MAGTGDMKAAEQTYSGFTRMVKWGTIWSVIIGALAVWLVAF